MARTTGPISSSVECSITTPPPHQITTPERPQRARETTRPRRRRRPIWYRRRPYTRDIAQVSFCPGAEYIRELQPFFRSSRIGRGLIRELYRWTLPDHLSTETSNYWARRFELCRRQVGSTLEVTSIGIGYYPDTEDPTLILIKWEATTERVVAQSQPQAIIQLQQYMTMPEDNLEPLSN